MRDQLKNNNFILTQSLLLGERNDLVQGVSPREAKGKSESELCKVVGCIRMSRSANALLDRHQKREIFDREASVQEKNT
jgi:hypothetical protein